MCGHMLHGDHRGCLQQASVVSYSSPSLPYECTSQDHFFNNSPQSQQRGWSGGRRGHRWSGLLWRVDCALTLIMVHLSLPQKWSSFLQLQLFSDTPLNDDMHLQLFERERDSARVALPNKLKTIWMWRGGYTIKTFRYCRTSNPRKYVK